MALPIRVRRFPDSARVRWPWMAALLGGAASCGHGSVGATGDATETRAAPWSAERAAEGLEQAGAGTASAAGALADAPSLVVHQARAKIHPTGHFDVKAWGGSSNTHTLLDDAGRGAVPVSE